MRLAAIDIGTNSTRLLIADLAGEKLREVERYLVTTRLGEGMEQGLLLPEPMGRAATAIAGYNAIARSYGAERIVAVATSCVRDASNRNEFLAMVKQRANLEVRVISGDQEAFLSYRGVLAGLTLNPGASLVLDIGGGSTELIWPLDGQIQTVSLQVGAVRFIANQWTESQVETLLHPILDRLKDLSALSLAGVGGTITTLAAMELRLSQYSPRLTHGYFLSAKAVERLYGLLKSLPPEERKKLPGLQPERADIIVGGTIILRTVLRQLNQKGLTVSESDILQGLLLEEAKK